MSWTETISGWERHIGCGIMLSVTPRTPNSTKHGPYISTVAGDVVANEIHSPDEAKLRCEIRARNLLRSMIDALGGSS